MNEKNHQKGLKV